MSFYTFRLFLGIVKQYGDIIVQLVGLKYQLTSLMVAGDLGSLGTHIHIGTVETSRHIETRHSYLRSYCGNPATREGKAHAFP